VAQLQRQAIVLVGTLARGFGLRVQLTVSTFPSRNEWPQVGGRLLREPFQRLVSLLRNLQRLRDHSQSHAYQRLCILISEVYEAPLGRYTAKVRVPQWLCKFRIRINR
jgi:hypothetical protein